jgi:caffeoyl-CoA O-methyltransferase
MKARQILILGLLLSLVGVAWSQRRGSRSYGRAQEVPTLARSNSEKRVLGVLDKAQRGGDMYLNVPVGDGRLLRVLAESIGAKNVVELGTSTGLSGMWFSLALQQTGGKLTTFEIDTGRAANARRNFTEAGVDSLVTVVEGDGHRNVSRLKEPIDLLFIDADKEGYLDYLNKLLPLIRPGGLILAHNVDSAPDYVKAVTTNPALETVFAGEGGGLGVTLKKR